MDFADLPQSIKIAAIGKRDEIASQLAGFVSPPFLPGEYSMVLAIAAGVLDDTTLAPAQLAYLPTASQVRAFADAYLAARALYNERLADLDAAIAVATASATVDEEATLAAIAAA